MPTLVVFHPDWLLAIVRAHCLPQDHTCGPYYLCPVELRDTPAAAHAYNPNNPPALPKSRTEGSSGQHSPVKVNACAGGQGLGAGGAEVGPHLDALPFTSLEPLVIQGKHKWHSTRPCQKPYMTHA